MSKDNNNEFIPKWRETAPIPGSFRSIFKWGAPEGFKHPNKRLFSVLKETFQLSDEDFREPQSSGDERVSLKKRPGLRRSQVTALKKIVGEENVEDDDYARVKYSTGKTAEEAMEMRRGKIGETPDLVLHPRDSTDVKDIIAYCQKHKIPVYPYGGGSSVNLGFRAVKGGISLVLSTHMNRVLEFNETNQTITVEAGLMGPAYEELLNNAPQTLGAARSYTCGHFPQSFEFSSVGGWVVTLGSGQASSYYGDACDIVLSMEFVTPVGVIRTMDFPGTATGPKVNDIIKGSEGAYGILTSVTMKIFRHQPENRERFAFIFPNWESAVEASREVTQAEFGMPAVFRISDGEETELGLKLYGVEDTFLDKLITLRGFKAGERCLCIGHTEGEKNFSKNVKKRIKKIARSHGAMYISGWPVKQWEHGRFQDPYLREDLNDYGIVIDTLESGVTWDNLHNLHQGVREFIKARPGTICMTHASHFYPQGTNLYFIFIARMENMDEYYEFHREIIRLINKHGGSLSHHHGVGKMIGPFLEEHLGPEQMDVLRSLKKHFDPKNIMNPGGTMGLDKGKALPGVRRSR